MNPGQTATVDRSSCPSVFDAGLPTINYEHAQHPDEAHAIIRKAPDRSGPMEATHRAKRASPSHRIRPRDSWMSMKRNRFATKN